VIDFKAGRIVRFAPGAMGNTPWTRPGGQDRVAHAPKVFGESIAAPMDGKKNPMKNHHHGHLPKAAPSPESHPSHEAIAELAHELWVARGHPDDSATEIWMEAETQLVANQSQVPLRPPISIAGP
jgi:hypothetical protein